MFKSTKTNKKPLIYDEKRLYQYGLYKLGQQEYSQFELKRKMLQFQTDLDIIDSVLLKLKSKNYLSDERRAKLIFNQYSSKEGLGKIKQRLKHKGISSDLIETIVLDYKESQKLMSENENVFSPEDLQIEIILELIARKYKTYAPENYNKMVGFLVRKGFDFGLISKSLKKFKETAKLT